MIFTLCFIIMLTGSQQQSSRHFWSFLMTKERCVCLHFCAPVPMCTAEWLLPVCWGRLILDSAFINQVVSTVCFIHIVCRWDSLRLAPTGIDVRVWEGVASGWGESPFQQDDLTSCLQLRKKKTKKPPQLSFMKSIHSHMRVLRHVHTNTHTYNPTCLLMGCWGDSCANEAIFRWDHCRMPWLLFPFQNSIKDVCLIPFIKLTHTCATSAEGEQKQWKLMCDKQAVVYTSSKQWTPLISYCTFLVSYNWWGKMYLFPTCHKMFTNCDCFLFVTSLTENSLSAKRYCENDQNKPKQIWN